MSELLNKYREEFDLQGLKLVFVGKKGSLPPLPLTSPGYMLSVPLAIADLPSIFIMPSKKGNRSVCLTEDLISLNSRLAEAVQEIYIITGRIVEDCLSTLREHISVLLAVSVLPHPLDASLTRQDTVALLDMLLSFAHTISGSDSFGLPPFPRPSSPQCALSSTAMAPSPSL